MLVNYLEQINTLAVTFFAMHFQEHRLLKDTIVEFCEKILCLNVFFNEKIDAKLAAANSC